MEDYKPTVLVAALGDSVSRREQQLCMCGVCLCEREGNVRFGRVVGSLFGGQESAAEKLKILKESRQSNFGGSSDGLPGG